MDKNELLCLLKDVLAGLRLVEIERAENVLHSIINNYELVICKLVSDDLTENLIKNSPREYLEIYSDYENPLLQKMDHAQKELNMFIVANP
ncbi:hypothetical protein SAMN03159444_01285 [Pseudomonas sp. NFACC02]|uniref:hypothetical protein n=1 Tax=Pseudomonas sp. NFACC02 TaxID=1566250 RepID=UPI0008CB4C9D|nr:hypothetical protein [Pseudomonas sp. NFACC02]SEQ23608.1 hypothetical protein SAMN03159444_01285 [Pseudomonas sp. NFACC02]